MSSTTPLMASASGGLDQTIQSIFGPVVDLLEAIVFFAIPVGGAQLPLLVLWLLCAGIFLTVWLKFLPWRSMRHTAHVVRGKYTRHDDPGEVTSFQALATELSGTVGLGNIAGVAVAITVGGPGATVWMILSGLLGMAVKMSEATLAQRYRHVNPDGTISGGPMYYLRDGLKELGRPRLGAALGMVFAFCMSIACLGAGNLFQANQVAAQLIYSTGGEESFLYGRAWIIGVVLAVLAGVIILGGLSGIAKWTGRLTPFMAMLYLVCVLVVLIANAGQLPSAAAEILSGAFSGKGVAGGAIGVAIIGIQRALFSNAAGVGTAGLAHSATKNRRPAQEGMVASWEPFIDSVVVCTLTALAITVTGQHRATDEGGVALTSAAFGSVHQLFPILLTCCIVLFGFSTMLAFSYYGRKTAGYVFGQSKLAERIYDGIYLVAIVVGSALSLDTVVRFSDAMFFIVTVPNLIGIYFLARVLRRELLGHSEDVATGQVPMVDPEDRSTLLGNPAQE